MILPHKHRVSLTEDIQMSRKRRFSETTVMSEFDYIKPYFTNACDELIPACPQDSSSPSDDIWKKFELLPTPPRSPQHSRDYDVEAKPDPLTTFVPEIDFDSYFVSPEDYTFSEENTVNVNKNSCECETEQQKLIKDCMWNGVGHKSSTERFRNSKNRRSSPGLSRSPCHANGCVDPRNIFPYPVGRPSCCDRNNSRFPSPPIPSLHSRCSTAVDGAETPSDSEEEIDVVTVESKQHNLNVLKSKNGQTGRLTTTSHKISGHLVPKENGALTLVRQKSGASNYVTKAFSDKQDNENRGRPRNKQIHVLSAANGQASSVAHTVAMVFERRGDGVKSVNDAKQLKLQKVQVKNIPLGNDVIKRRHTTEEPLMRLANPKSVMQRSDSLSPKPTTGKMSLDGISFSSTTGARQYTTEYNRQKENGKWPNTVSALKTAQEAALNVLAVRGKPKSRIQTNGNRRKIDENETTGIMGSPPMKRKRKAETVNSGSSGSGSDSEQIRAAHNVLERQRREGLRASFHELRDHVPELRNMEKTPKVNILNKARDYCLELAESERRFVEEKKSLLKRQELLQRRLQRLTEVRCDTSESSGVESDIDESKHELLSPESSLPSSPQVFPAQSQTGFIIARRVSNEERKNGSQPEVLLCLEPCTNNASRQSSHRKRYVLTPSEYSGTKAKQIKYIANLQKKTERNLTSLLSFQNSEALSDGFDEYYESEEENRSLLQTAY